MWVTKRRTKQASKVYNKRRIFLSIATACILVIGGLGVYTYVLFFVPPPLLLPIPLHTDAAPLTSQEQTTQTLKKKLSEIGVTVTEVKKNPEGNYEVALKDSGYIIISQSRNLSEQIASLQVILKRLTMEGKRFTKLDMRFDKPVITTN